MGRKRKTKKSSKSRGGGPDKFDMAEPGRLMDAEEDAKRRARLLRGSKGYLGPKVGEWADPDAAYSLKQKDKFRAKSAEELALEKEFSKEYDEFAAKQKYPADLVEPYVPQRDPKDVKV
jgi:hypothetical protein